MADHLSLIEFIRRLLGDDDLQQEFREDPAAALGAVGLGDIDAHDVRDTLLLVADDSFAHGSHGGGHHHAPEPWQHESAAEYVHRFVVANNFVDARETHVDSALRQHIDTDGGDFDQDLDYHPVTASGDGAVAAGEDIEDSTITTGNGNQVGSGNVSGDGNVVGTGNQAVTGDGNTAGFGEGDVASTSVGGDLTLGDGAAFASGGSAAVDNSDNSVDDSYNTAIDESTNDSFNDSSDNSVNDSGNTSVDASSDDSGNTETTTEISDSFNNNSDNSQNIEIDLPV